MKSIIIMLGAASLIVISFNYPRPVFPHAATSNTVLFDREIVRILNEHCVMCHVSGSASFPLATYEEVWLSRDAVHDAILARHMPPWAAVSGYREFVNANQLTLRETRFFVSWVEGLGPRNAGEVFLNVLDPQAAEREAVRAGIDFDTWELGEPEIIIDVPPFTAAAEPQTGTPLRMARSVIDLRFESERWLNGLEYHPGERSTIRAVEFSIEATGQWLATWTPWHGTRHLPADAGYRLRPGARIVATFLAADTTRAREGNGEIGLYFTSGSQVSEMSDAVLEAKALVPADVRNQPLRAQLALGTDTTVLALWPVLPQGTESIEVTARRRDGTIEILLLALEIPLDWPTSYVLETPVSLQAGTELTFIAYASNTSGVAMEKRARLAVSTY